MATIQATFINEDPGREYHYNQRVEIEMEVVNGKIKVTSPRVWPTPDAIFYDTLADFYKDWKIGNINPASEKKIQELIKHIKTKE